MKSTFICNIFAFITPEKMIFNSYPSLYLLMVLMSIPQTMMEKLHFIKPASKLVSSLKDYLVKEHQTCVMNFDMILLLATVLQSHLDHQVTLSRKHVTSIPIVFEYSTAKRNWWWPCHSRTDCQSFSTNERSLKCLNPASKKAQA